MGDRAVSSQLAQLFQDVTSPPVSVIDSSSVFPNDSGYSDHNDDLNTLRIPDEFSVRVGGGGSVVRLLSDISAFNSLSLVTRKGLLDLLYLILRRGTYDVVRFRCQETLAAHSNPSSSSSASSPPTGGVIPLLLRLLAFYANASSINISLSKRIIRLIGILAAPSIAPCELKSFLKFLRLPSLLSNSLLHALKTMIRQDDSIVKSAPGAFFNFGGTGAGLYSYQSADFLRNEFQICFWFRIETFRSVRRADDGEEEQQFVSCSGSRGNGFKVYTREKRVFVDVTDAAGAVESFAVENFQLRKGVWYHASVTHSRARYALFNRSKMIIRLDGVLCFEQFVGMADTAAIAIKPPALGGKPIIDLQLIIGKNLDGQIGAVYLFSDPLPSEAVDVISRLNARKPVEGYRGNVSIDLVPVSFTADGKTCSLAPSIIAVFHPSRVFDGLALDVHNGRHALLGPLTYAWIMQSARDVMAALGGVSCLLPLFPRLLIENEGGRNKVAAESGSSGLGTSLADIYDDADCYCYLSDAAIEILSIDKIEVSDEGCIGLMLSVVSRCVQSHHVYLHDLAVSHGIGMIEYALSNVSPKILGAEGDTCAVALLELKQVVGGSAILENSAIKHLLSNFKVWSKASYFFQKSLISILHTAVAEQPAYFIRTVGTHWLLDQVLYFVPSPSPKEDSQTSNNNPGSDITSSSETPSSPNRRRFQRYQSIYVSAQQMEGSDSVVNDARSALISGSRPNSERMMIDIGEPVAPKSPKAVSRFRAQLNKEMEEEPDGSSGIPDVDNADAVPRSSSVENDNKHKFYMRNNLYSILYILVQNDAENKELESMFSFMDKCKDAVVLNEVCQLVLCFIIEMGSAALNQIINACASPEGFTSFLIFRLISHPSEDVRSTAIRMLTHFYQRLRDASSAAQKNLMAHVFEAPRAILGINRLQESGGLYLVSKMLENKYCADSSMPTYTALLEMLVTVHGSERKLYKYADADKNAENTGKLSKNGALRVFALAPFSLPQTIAVDEQDEGINECLLSHIFNIIPRLNDSVEDYLYSDLMNILKQNSENRDAFCASPHWNNFIFQLSRRYVVLDNTSAYLFRSDDILACLKSFTDGSNLSRMSSPRTPNGIRGGRQSLRIIIDEPKEQTSSTYDIRFTMCMRVNSTLVVHATKYKNGWLSIIRALVVMQDAAERHVLTQAILSHALNDLTFGMASRFRDLMGKVISDVPAVKQDAYDQLENFLVLIIVVSITSLSFPVSVKNPELLQHWRYLNPNELKPDDGKSTPRDISSASQHFEELMHPLERNHNVDHGRMVLVLQCLRFFDVMFSSSDGGVLRNGQILKYSVRQLDKKATADLRRERISLLSAGTRMCIFVQMQLCPFTELAVVNLRRMSSLIKTMDKVPQNSTPVEAWVIIILHNVFHTMLQIRTSLLPLFRDFGFSPDYGCSGASDEEIYEIIKNELPVLTKIESLFDSKVGLRLIAYVRQLAVVMLDIYKSKMEHLSVALGETVFQSYSTFARNIIDPIAVRKRASSMALKKRRSKSSISFDMSLRSTASGLSEKGDWCDVSDSASEKNEMPKDAFLCDDVVLIFRYLRDPFFLIDMASLDAVITAFDVARAYEKRCLFDFSEDLIFLRTKMQAHDNAVGRDLQSMPTWSSSVRVQRYGEMTLAKSVATSWQSILKTFEAEWSPWHSTEEEGLRCYELTRHVDRLGRRNVLTRVSDTKDYTNVQYYNSRRQASVEKSNPGTPMAPGTPIAGSFLNAPSSFLRDALKLTMDSRKKNMVEEWGKEDSIVFEENLQTLQEKRPIWALNIEWGTDEYIAYTSEATSVGLEHSMSGTVLLTNKHLYFHPRKFISGLGSEHNPVALKTRRWVLECLVETFGRRHLLKNCGIELFFLNCPEVFLAFHSLKELQKFFYTLRRQNVPNLVSPATLNPKQVCASLNWTELWRRRIISNFEYLIILNKMAGRSFNDLTQYPVFPWIIADYTSHVLDLNNPKTYRDLTKPIGALNSARLKEIMERYNNSFDDVDIPKFMYGSHYSSAGVVLHYLIRQEPFTHMAISFQGGKFDCPDRLFFDFKSTWDSLNNSLTDVKELIPEFFCCPEMLLNTNKLPLGPLQDGITIVDNVVLPPWAKDAFDFTRLQREALESEYVSNNLHHWIDLIFGYKQTGDAAIEAKNLFYYLTYENAINIEEIADPMARDATISQVTNFGQTPSQIFTKPHLPRLPERDTQPYLFGDKRIITSCSLDVFTYATMLEKNKHAGPVLAIQSSKTQLVAYHGDLTISYFKFAVAQDGSPFQQVLRFEKSRVIPCAQLSTRSEQSMRRTVDPDAPLLSKDYEQRDIEDSGSPRIGRRSSRGLFGTIGNLFGMSSDKKEQYSQDMRLKYFEGSYSEEETSVSSHLVALSVVDGSGGRIISCGYWDNSLRVHHLDSLREIVSVSSGHVGAITCVQLDRLGGNTVITGGADGTCRVWLLENFSCISSFYENLKPKGVDLIHDDLNLACVHVLCGHQTPLTCMHYSPDMDVLLSASLDGTLCLHSVRNGSFIHTITKLQGVNIDLVYVASLSYLIVHSWSKLRLWLFWVNGQELASTDQYTSIACSAAAEERIECFVMNGANADVLVCGGSEGKVYFLDVTTLYCLRILDISANGPIKTLRFSDGTIDNQYLMIGSRNGTFSICMDLSRSLVDKAGGIAKDLT